MRFTLGNWEKFFDGSNKQTTIRLHKSKIGMTNAYMGSYYRPVKLGTFEIFAMYGKPYKFLSEIDARLDGFKSLAELQAELQRLNGKIEPDTFVYIHLVRNPQRADLKC